MSEPLPLRLDDVHVQFPGGKVPALAGCTLEVGAGERVALLGLNGSGKTTLLLSLVGLVPHRGRIDIGNDVLGAETVEAIRNRTGFLFSVPDDQILFPKVLDDVVFSLTQRGMRVAEARERALAMLAALDAAGLAERSPYDLSHGQRVRVALAGVLAPAPGLLLLDEPSAGLDPPARHRLAGLLSRVDATVLLATHDVSFAAAVCTRYILLENGRVVRQGADLAAMEHFWDLPSPI